MNLTIASIEPVQGTEMFKIHLATTVNKLELKELLNTSKNHEVPMDYEIVGI